MFHMISSKIVFSLISYMVFDQKIAPKMFENFRTENFRKISKIFEISIFRENRKIRNFYNWIPIVKFRIFRFSKIFEDFFSTKINFPRKIFFFIENFCIRRVIRNCFSLCPGDLKLPKLLFVAQLFLKMWRVIVKYHWF